MKIHSNIKILFVSFIISFLFSLPSLAQVAGGHHQKLFDLYVMGRYETCLHKAMKMTENDKYKSESEPYLWVAMCLYTFVGDDEMELFYPKCKKDAIKYGVKFKKKDDKIKKKEGDYLFDANREFIYKLIDLSLVEGKSFAAMDNFSKASYYYKLAYGMDKENMALRMLLGTMYMYNRNTKEGKILIEQALDYYKDKAAQGGYKVKEDSRSAFEDAFLYYARYLQKKGNNNDAFEIMALAIKLEPENNKFITLYKELS